LLLFSRSDLLLPFLLPPRAACSHGAELGFAACCYDMILIVLSTLFRIEVLIGGKKLALRAK
jgi:hypothetical protein